MRNEIIAILTKLETEKDCKILFACESGSRAWGFPSPDSDYDVRFIYAKPVDWYLKIAAKSDTINIMLPHDIDLSGWELMKAMRLFAKGNLCLFEWLGSPEIYSKNEKFYSTLKSMIPAYFNPKKAIHHYFNTAIKIKEEHLQGYQVGIKKLFYIIRPLLACNWIIDNQTMPPTEFNKLYTEETVPDFVNDYIDRLLREKSRQNESHKIMVPKEIFTWINAMLDKSKNSLETLQPGGKTEVAPLNRLIQTIILS